MPRSIRIRAFEAADTHALARLFHASVHGAGIRHYSPEQVAAWSPSVPDPGTYVRRAQTRTLLVAVDDEGAIVGYGDLEPDGHIDHLYCHPDKLRAGVGTAICTGLEAAARTAGIAVLSVEASEGARGLFERQGFTLGSRNDLLFDGAILHNYRMSKQLDRA
jgi:putative acetyltransferase